MNYVDVCMYTHIESGKSWTPSLAAVVFTPVAEVVHFPSFYLPLYIQPP